MAAPAAPVQCSNADCRVAETGRCVEGKALTDCARYGKPREPVSSAGTRSSGIPLASAGRLVQAEAVRLLRASESRVVAVVAPADSGKTSLIGAVYDLLQTSVTGPVSFAGSSTLHALEDACHDSRSASERDEPEQKRTPVGKVNFFHLELEVLGAHEHIALLIADRAGEEYRLIADDPTVGEPLFELRRADSISLLVDGSRLLDSGERHNLHGELSLILKALVDTNVLWRGQHLVLILTKLDAIRASEHEQRAQKDFKRIVEKFQALYATSFASIAAFQVAASPKTTVVTRALGVVDILKHWLASPAIQSPAEQQPIEHKRAFARLSAER